MGKLLVVNISDMKISSNPEEVIITYSLGSCIAVVLYDPVLRIGGMIHIMLPESQIEKDPQRTNPYKFVDTGVPLLFKDLLGRGSKRNHLIVKLIGGSNVMDANKFFNIGERNHIAIRKILWKNNILIKNEDIGGTKSRTVKLFIDSGKVVVSNAFEEYEV